MFSNGNSFANGNSHSSGQGLLRGERIDTEPAYCGKLLAANQDRGPV